jgi:ubiquinone/menaquinone biosynthesis C-methylase UbiE
LSKERLIHKFDKQAKMYEIRRKKLTVSRRSVERVWREKLISDATGKVLEVAVGAGANFHFYSKDVEVTAVDFSGEMLRKAQTSAADNGIRAEFLQSDVESLSFPDDSFDTVVSTLSFCGYEDPHSVLTAFQKWCKPGGRILLMEHGLGSNRLLRGCQHALDPVFNKMVGCHCNRDLTNILAKSGIHIHRAERHMLDMVHLVWATPHK